MQLAQPQRSLLDKYLDHFQSLIGDRRTERLLRGVVQGIIGAESLICARIAAFSPSPGRRGQEHRATDSTDG